MKLKLSPWNLEIVQPRLFLQKLAALLISTLILVPLVYYKWWISAQIYVGVLLVLHVFFLYVYFSRVPWRQLWSSRRGFTLRLAGVLFFTYLLGMLKFNGSVGVVLANLAAATLIHIAILALFMIRVVRQPAQQT